jgi:hypothetical protein
MTLKSLGQRILMLEDIEEIKKLQVQYLNCLITTKWDDLIECFAENAVLNLESGSATGREIITKHFKEKVSLNNIGQEGSFVVHPIITIEGNKAKGSWLLYTRFAQPRILKSKPDKRISYEAPDWIQGYYEMEYVRQNGKWKISYLKFDSRLTSPMTLLKDFKP